MPPRPVASEVLELRATSHPSVRELVAEVEIDGELQRHPMALHEPSTRLASEPLSDYLAEAAPRPSGGGRRVWFVRLGPLSVGNRLRYRFAAPNARPTSLFEVTVASWQNDGGRIVLTGPGATTRLEASGTAWLRADAGPIKARFALRLEPGAHVMGFGERFDQLDQRGARLDAVVYEQYKGQGQRTYLPIPFAIVVPNDGAPGWGFHVRTARRTWYDVGASDPSRLTIEVALDANDLDPTVEVATYRGTPAEILAAFLDEVGQPSLPPDWVFRPWMSGNEWNTQSRVRAEIERSLAESIPVGVVVIEAWSDETTFVAFRDASYQIHRDGAPHRLADFAFPPSGAWPDPKALIEWLHGQDVRVLLWQVPLLRARPAPRGQARADRDTMVERGYAVHEADGRPYRNRGWWFPGALLPDWTNDSARTWWLAKRRYLLDELGIDGFKTDGGEHAWGDDLRYADGTHGSEGNNRYPVLYAAAYHELMRSSGREPVTFSRAGFTGAGSFPCHWAGDADSTWADFRASIIAGLTAGASGIFFWGWDLAGFSGDIPDAELYLRSAAMACFSPIMQYHSEYNRHRRPSRDRTPWNIAERTGDPRVIPIYRRFAKLRDRLVPYLAAQARRSVGRRLPLMRALCFGWPEDPTVWDYPFEYLLGDDILVAPVVQPSRSDWEVYLPAGKWIHAWDGSRIDGPFRTRTAAPLDEIPAFVRVGAEAVLQELFKPLGGGRIRRHP